MLMKRRTFLKIVSSAGVVSLFSPAFVLNACKKTGAGSYSLASEFNNPPFASGVYTWWHWMNGNITKEGITRDLEAMKENGIAGFQLFEAGSGIPVGPVESLGNQWVELIQYTLKESQRLGLEFAMHNCPGWSSSGGPWITPDRAMKLVTWSETQVAGGTHVEQVLPLPQHNFDYYLDTYCLAVPAGRDVLPLGEILNLTSYMNDDGVLFWDAPEGKWSILRFGYTAKNQQNHSAPTKSTGLDCDKFSTEALDYHLDCMFKQLKASMAQAKEHIKVGLLIDSYEMGEQNWAYDFPAYFEQKCGYELWPYLPVLAQKVVDDEDTVQRFLYDFHRVQADLFAERYYAHFQKRCKEQGYVTYTEPYGGGMMEELQVAQLLDINMGEFWCGQTVLWPNFLLNRTVKQVASVSHVLGKKIIGAEAFTAEPDSDKWLQYPYALKSLGDYMFTQGLTRIYFHRYAHQPHPTAAPGMTMGPWGIHFDRTNTWWKPGKAWIKYLNRCQHVFQCSSFYADILYLQGDNLFGTTVEPEKTAVAPPEGYDYDIVNAGMLSKSYVEKGCIKFPTAVSEGYKILVLADTGGFTLDTLRILKQLADEGIAIVGQKPSCSIGLTGRKKDNTFKALVDNIWEHRNVYQDINLKELLSQKGYGPDFTYQSSQISAVHAIHYQHEKNDIYFVANRKRTGISGIASFRISGKVPEYWNPYTGLIVPCAVYIDDGQYIRIPLHLSSAESIFVVFVERTVKNHWEDLQFNHVSQYQIKKDTEYPDEVSANFSICCWIKPELDIALTEEQEFGEMCTRNFAFYPMPAETIFGKGHAAVGISVGRNGIVVYERTLINKAVCRFPMAISGWIHLVLLYRDNTPTLWVNGQCIGEGPASSNVVHGVMSLDKFGKVDAFDGELLNLRIVPSCLSKDAIVQDFGKGLPTPQSETDYSWISENKFVAWQTGTYTLIKGDVSYQKNIQSLLPDKELVGPWEVSFPPGLGAPEHITLSELHSLHLEQDFGVRHFSGTMVYRYSISIGKEYLQNDICLRLCLGRVEVLAEIFVNGKYAGICWAPPYTIDIQNMLHDGANQIEIHVTNLWVNRLIGDEYLPEENEYEMGTYAGKFSVLANGGIKKLPEWYLDGKAKPLGGRVAFTTWKHYDRNSPLTLSGLLGPVVLQVGKIVEINVQ